MGVARRSVWGPDTCVEVDRGYVTPCWEVTWGGKFYAVGWVDGRRGQINRLLWEKEYGVRIPPGRRLMLHHMCEHPLCVRPDHQVLIPYQAHQHLHRLLQAAKVESRVPARAAR